MLLDGGIAYKRDAERSTSSKAARINDAFAEVVLPNLQTTPQSPRQSGCLFGPSYVLLAYKLL